MNEYVASTSPCAGALFVRVVEARVPETLLGRGFLKQQQADNNKKTEEIAMDKSESQTAAGAPRSLKRSRRAVSRRWAFGKRRGTPQAPLMEGEEGCDKTASSHPTEWTNCVLEFDDTEVEIPLHSFVCHPQQQQQPQQCQQQCQQQQQKETCADTVHTKWARDVAVVRKAAACAPMIDEHAKSPTARQEQQDRMSQPAAECPASGRTTASETQQQQRAYARSQAQSKKKTLPPPPVPRVVIFRPSQACIDKREHEVVFDVQEYYGSARITAQLQRVSMPRGWSPWGRGVVNKRNRDAKCRVALGTGWTPLHTALSREHKEHVDKLALTATTKRGSPHNRVEDPREFMMPPADERRPLRSSTNSSPSHSHNTLASSLLQQQQQRRISAPRLSRGMMGASSGAVVHDWRTMLFDSRPAITTHNTPSRVTAAAAAAHRTSSSTNPSVAIISAEQEKAILRRRIEAAADERVQVYLSGDLAPSAHGSSSDGQAGHHHHRVGGLPSRRSSRNSIRGRSLLQTPWRRRHHANNESNPSSATTSTILAVASAGPASQSVVVVLEIHFAPMPASTSKLVSTELHRTAVAGNLKLMRRLLRSASSTTARASGVTRYGGGGGGGIPTSSGPRSMLTSSVYQPTRDSLAMTPLHLAARLGHEGVVNHLRKVCRASLLGQCVKKHSSRGQTIIHQAVLGGNAAVLEQVLDIVNVSATSHAIRMTMASRAHEMINLGLDDGESAAARGARDNNEYDIFDLRDCCGYSALALACKLGGDSSCAEYNNKPSSGGGDKDSCSGDDAQPKEGLERRAARADAFELVKLLATHGADVSVADNEGNTPLVLACKAGDAPVVEYLLSLRSEDGPSMMTSVRCRPNMPNHQGQFALHIAASTPPTAAPTTAPTTATEGGGRGGVDVTSLRDSDSYAQGGAFMASIRSSGVRMVRALLANGSSLTVRDRNGCTALHHAARAGNIEIVAVLVCAINAAIDDDGSINNHQLVEEETSPRRSGSSGGVAQGDGVISVGDGSSGREGGEEEGDSAPDAGEREVPTIGRGIGTDGRGGDGKRRVPRSLFLCRDARTMETASETASRLGFCVVATMLGTCERDARAYDAGRRRSSCVPSEGGGDAVGFAGMGFGRSWEEGVDDDSDNSAEGDDEAFVFVDDDAQVGDLDDSDASSEVE